MANRRLPSAAKLRASGMSEDEIAELLGMQNEVIKDEETRERELLEMQEVLSLEKRAHEGQIDEEGLQKLRNLRGVFYTFNF